jgi:hypothetical protein
MDRSEVKRIIEANLEPLMEAFGVPHWTIKVDLDIEGDARGRCTRKLDYNQAYIEIDFDRCEDADDLLHVLRHELCHVVVSPFDLYMEAAREALRDDPSALNILDRVWDHACEKSIINLGRLWIGAAKYRGPVGLPAKESR